MRLLLLRLPDSLAAPLLQALAGLGEVQALGVFTREELEQALDQGAWDLALGAAALPDAQGGEHPAQPLLAARAPATPWVALVPAGDHAAGLAAQRLGAADYLCADEAPRLPALAERVLRDAAELRRAQKALQNESSYRAYLRYIFESSPEAIVFHGPDFRIADVNAGFTGLFGYTREEAVGRTLRELVTPLEQAEEFTRHVDQIRSGQLVRTESVRRRKDGSLVQVGIVAFPISNGDGPVGIYVKYTDLTPRMKALEAFRQAESNYRSIFLDAVEGIYLSTPVGRFVTVNPAMARLLGYDTPSDLADTVKSISREVYADPTVREDVLQSLRETGRLLNFRTRLRRKDGSLVEVLENARAIHDDDGELLYFQGVILPAPPPC